MENSNKDENTGRPYDNSNKKTKRIILAVFCAMLVFMIICLMIPRFQEMRKEEEETYNNSFHDTYAEGFDIKNYEEYMSLDRSFMYYDGTGIGSGVIEENLNSFNPGVTVIYRMINALIDGDVKAYNECLGDGVEKLEYFTQQQIYKISLTSKVSDSGAYEFTLSYKIHENNGSYRIDIGSDESRSSTITVSNVSGKYLVESMRGIVYGK